MAMNQQGAVGPTTTPGSGSFFGAIAPQEMDHKGKDDERALSRMTPSRRLWPVRIDILAAFLLLSVIVVLGVLIF
jgi:hypothetical protein